MSENNKPKRNQTGHKAKTQKILNPIQFGQRLGYFQSANTRNKICKNSKNLWRLHFDGGAREKIITDNTVTMT